MKSTVPRVIIGSLILWTLLALLAIALIVILDEAPAQHAALPEYLRPFRPVGIRVINAVGVLLGKAGLLDKAISLDPDHLLSSACSKLGRTHPESHCVLILDAEDHWHTSFRLFTTALRDAKLTFLGRVIAQGQLMQTLETRGRLLEQFREDSFVDASPLHDPIFVIGLPRTGTTLLSRLLSMDPANRGPTLWEYLDPVPRPPPPPPLNAPKAELDSYRLKTKDRISDRQWKLDQYKSLAPGFDSMHPLNATDPEECIVIMNYAMDSEQVAAIFPIHEYFQWLIGSEDHLDTLRWNKRVMQHLQKGDPYGPRRWVLNTPYYLAMMDDIRAVYPNAKIIHTHRDPKQSVLSVSSLMAKMHSIVTDDIDLKRIGSQQAAIRETMLEKALNVRKKWAEDDTCDAESSFRIFDVHLQDLQKDPMGTVNMIYEALFDAELTPGASDLMQKWLEHNPRTKHGTHRPTMAEFGIEDRMNTDVFRAYENIFRVRKAASLSDKTQRAKAKHEATDPHSSLTQDEI